MTLGYQLICVWVSIQLVSVVSETTQSTCNMTRFKWVKSDETGDVLCATSPSPTATVKMKSTAQCSWLCAHSPAVCAGGFNFKHRETRCEMFLNPPTTFELQQDCEYYKVCTCLCHSEVSLQCVGLTVVNRRSMTFSRRHK